MSTPIIGVLGQPPSRALAPASYVSAMDAWLAALVPMVTEINTFGTFLNTTSTIIGGALNATTIGLSTPAAGKFTDVELTGKQGIGTPTPVTALHIVGTGVSDSKITLDRSGAVGVLGIVGNALLLSGLGNDGFNGGVVFMTGAVETMKLDEFGLLDVGNGKLTLNGNQIGGGELTIAVDAVGSFTPPRNGGFAFLTQKGSTTTPNHLMCQSFFYDVGSTVKIEKGPAWISLGGDIEITTSDVTGTTGTDGKTTIAVQPGVIKIENRSNAATPYQLTFI